MWGCIFLSHTVRVRKKSLDVPLSVSTTYVVRTCFLVHHSQPQCLSRPSSLVLVFFVCFPDRVGWNLFTHFIYWCKRKEESALALSLTRVACHSFYRMKKKLKDSFDHSWGRTPRRTDLNSCFEELCCCHDFNFQCDAWEFALQKLKLSASSMDTHLDVIELQLKKFHVSLS